MGRDLFQQQETALSFPEVFNYTQKFMTEKYRNLISGDAEKNKNQIRSYVEQFLVQRKYTVSGYSFDTLVDKLIDEMTGFSILTPYLDFRIPKVEEININSWDDVKVTFDDGHYEPAIGEFYSPEHAHSTIQRLLLRSRIILDDSTPCVRGHLNKKIRITVNGPGVIDEDVGVTTSIRFVNPNKLGEDDFIKNGTATKEMLDNLSILYRYGASMCLAGPTGSGKTTLMQWIMSTISNDKRLYTVEYETREFDLVKRDENGKVINNVIHTVTRNSKDPDQIITAQKLIEQGLTFNPDYFCMSEIKGIEAYTTQQAARTNITTITTVHANAARQIHDRVLDLCCMAGNISEKLLYRFVVEAFPIVFHIKKNRIISEICEGYIDNDGKRQLNTLYKFHTLYNEEIKGKTITHGKFERVGTITEALQETLLDNGIPQYLLKKLLGGESA